MPLTTVDQGLLSTNAQYTGFKNRLINGDMTIDQRNNGAAVTVTTASGFFAADRFANWNQSDGGVTAQRISDAPSGFNNSLRITITSTDTSLAPTQYVETRQLIEGFNVADLGWGTANAQTVTLSFWVKSSLTGTFGGSFMNSDVNRAYPYSYTISSANTWEYKTVTVPGDTTGTWEKTNGNGMFVILNLGAGTDFQGTANAWVAARRHTVSGAVSLIGTNGATWQVTGVQLEKGSTATSFDYLPYGTEMQLCQRYFQQHGYYGLVGQGQNNDRNSGGYVSFPVPMRTTPSTLTRNYEVDIGDLIVSFTPLLYLDSLGQAIGWRPYRNTATTITRGDTLTIDPFGTLHPFNAEL
jgi:hypothetical protein